MGFEAPFALLALAAAGLPVLAHLLRRADLPVRQLPTIALLRKAEATSRQRMRLVDLLLLIARILLIAALALAVSGPYWNVVLPYGDGTSASIVIVLDDSMSMTARGDPPLFEQARARAREIVQSLPPGSEIALVLAGSPARVPLARSDDLDAAAAAIAALDPSSARGTALVDAVERARHELAGARHAQRRIIALTDLARHTRITEVPVASGVEVRFEAIGQDADTSNAGIVAARATPDPTAPGMVSVAVEVRASNDLEGERAGLTLTRGGEVIANSSVEFGPRGARATLHAPIDANDPAARVVLDLDDAVATDNVRGVLLRPPAGARVLIVDGDPHPIQGDDEARFLARAIDLAPEQGGALQRRTVDPDTFATLDLSDAEVIVLANVPTPDARVVSGLRQHVEAGGGLLVAPGDHFDARAMVAALGDLWPARPRDSVGAVGDPIGGPFGAGAELVPAGGSGLERTITRRRITFEDLPQDASAPLRFADGSPALVLAPRGDGRVAVIATTLDDDWTDLPYQPGFLPLMVRTLRLLAPSAGTTDTAYAAGQTVSLRAPAGAAQLRVTTPSGATFETDELGEPVEITDTETPGVYRAAIATRDRPLHEEPRLAFLVAPPPEESDLTPGEAPVSEGSSHEPSGGAVVRRSLAPWLFLLAGLLALGEAGLRIRIPKTA